MSNNTIDPTQYKKNARGNLVHVDNIKPIDLERDALVHELFEKAAELSALVTKFKAQALDDINAFVELSAEKYGAKLGGKKGNVYLTSFDGKYKVVRSISESIAFDERLQAAKSLIHDCLDEWTADSRPEIRTLIDDAFQVDKSGSINTSKVLGLRRLSIQHEKWRQAMEAISDSIQYTDSKTFIRFYKRNPDGSYQALSLDSNAV